MKNWTDCLIYLTQSPENWTRSKTGFLSSRLIFVKSCLLFGFLLTFNTVKAQSIYDSSVFRSSNYLETQPKIYKLTVFEVLEEPNSLAYIDTVPKPRTVLYQSLIIPGWGQVTNRQVWKVPVIYGMLAGVTMYTFYAHDRYQGYKAAYYNSIAGNTDLRFGPTPGYIPPGQPPELYRSNRNTFRNRRDLSIIGIFLVYGLNIADAYIFAHLRDFDVSDDLSARIDPTIQNTDGRKTASLTLKISF